MQSAAEHAGNSIGFYGYNTDSFIDSQLPVDGKPDPLQEQLARCMSLMVNGEAPAALSYIATAGGLTPINKIPHIENMNRIAAGQDPRLRPVNSGVQHTRQALKTVLQQPSAQHLKEFINETNIGFGVPGGCEKMASIMTALYKQDGIISTEDAKNGFNALTRQVRPSTMQSNGNGPNARPPSRRFTGGRA